MFGKARACSLFALTLLIASSADAAPMRVKVVDRTEAAFPDVLVIVKSLDGKGEVGRALTDATGSVPERELTPGLYRVIATCPYGICETKIFEFLIRDVPVQLDLKLDVLPTRGDVVQVGPSRSLKVEVVDQEGRPTRLARILVRDPDAQNERWYKTGSDGSAIVELPEGLVTVVVVYEVTLASKTLRPSDVSGLRAKNAPLTIRLE
jgi:hypothetical protein